MNYSSAWFEGDPSRDLAAGAMGQGAARAATNAACSRASACWRSAAAGAALAEYAARALRRAGHRRHAVHRAAGLRAGSGCARRAWPTRPTCGCRTTATSADGPLRRHRLDRDVRGRRPRVLAAASSPRCASCSSPAAAPASRASRSATTCSSATCARTDFIQQYIFPGGLLPSPTRLPRAGRARPGCAVVNELAFGADYAETLRRWRVRFLAAGSRRAPAAASTALHAHLGVLPRLLRSRLRHRQHRRHAVHAANGMS